MHNLVSQWIPPNQRSRFAGAYMGGSVGIAVFYPIFGFIISLSSWEWIFYLTTTFATIWFISWQYFVYDSPSQHPRIDPSELNYIKECLGDSVEKNRNVMYSFYYYCLMKFISCNCMKFQFYFYLGFEIFRLS